MFIFGDFRAPFGIYGNMQEVPRDDTEVHGGGMDPIEDGCLRGAAVLVSILIGLFLLIILSVIFLNF